MAGNGRAGRVVRWRRRRPRRQRVGVYGVCVDADRILLSRYAGGARRWSLPGGGLEHGEEPLVGVRREVEEETGYVVRVDELLGVDTALWDLPDVDIHAVNILYAVSVVGGELRNEVGGSSDRAAWIELAALPGLAHTPLTRLGLDLLAERPPTGSLASPAPTGG
ncbi:MAG TPA: NUDIX domain-containing protein [Actinopolymorphaceae bacterium]